MVEEIEMKLAEQRALLEEMDRSDIDGS